MNKRRSGWIIVGVMLVGMLLFCAALQRGDITYATAVGTVRTGQKLAVRKGPGNDYDILKNGGSSVRLENKTQVTILAQNKKWYKIRFRDNGKRLVGYVPMKNLSVMSGDISEEVYGKAYPSAVLVRTRAVRSGSLMRVDGTAVRLSKNKKVRIISESVMYGVKYYKISFSYGGKKKQGYVPADAIAAEYDSALPGVISTSRQVSLRKKAGSTVVVRADDGAIFMENGTEVLMLGEKTVSGVKYVCIDVDRGEKTYRGYVTANLVRFQQVEVEDVVNGEQENLFVEESTPAPTATAVAQSTGQPAQSDETTAAETPVLTDKQFKKQLVSEGFPSSYFSALQALHEKYPKWQFKAYQTGIDWSTAVDNESAVGLNLISNSKSSAWKSQEEGAYNASTGTYIPFDGSTWVTASEKAVCYYMDPRNFLDDENIFQFESLSYQEGIQNQKGVEKVLQNTPMYQTSYEYTDDTGQTVTTTYSKTFMAAAALSGVSPYHLASRVKQEVVTGTTSMSSSVSGTVSGFEGIYNFYNIGANNSTKAGGAVANGLSWASQDTTYMRPWNTKYKAIVGGAQYLGSNYINVGQNTLYLQKFNVTGTSTYNHQYMSNIEAPWSEALKTAEAYGADKADMSLVFSIPVYSGMPSAVCASPAGDSTVQRATVQKTSASPNNYLKSLKVKRYAFTTRFQAGDDGSKVYEVKVSKKVKTIRIVAAASNAKATVSGTGVKKLGKSVKRKNYVVKVKAQNGDIRKYRIRVTRKNNGG